MIQIQGIIENRDTQNLAYILQYPNLFFQTGYKVLQGQEKNGFIRCTKVLHNGKDKLIYDISKYKSLDTLLPGLRPDTFMTVVMNLIDVVIEVKNNGFMQCENIDLSFDKIFVDCNNFKVYLIYLPIDTPTNKDSYEIFENQFKSNVISTINSYANLSNSISIYLCECMKNPINSIENIKQALSDNNGYQAKAEPTNYNTAYQNQTQENQFAYNQSSNQTFNQPYNQSNNQQNQGTEVLNQNNQNSAQGFNGQQQYANQVIANVSESKKKKGLFSRIFGAKNNKQQATYEPNFQAELEGGATEILDDIFMPSIVLSGVKTPEKIDFVINKEEFVIGKKADSVDGLLAFSNAISRIHCKIIYADGRYFIVDLGSANGTYVNGVRINSNQQTPIKQGDRIRLANNDFIIKSI